MLDINEPLYDLKHNGFEFGLDVEAFIVTLFEIEVQILPEKLKNEAIMISE